MMKNLRKHTDRLKEVGSPAQRIGEFLIRHSNSPGYLVSNLESILACCQEDLQAEKDLFRSLTRGLQEEK